MRLVYLTVGFVSLGLGIIGIPCDFNNDPFCCYRWLLFAKVPNALKCGSTNQALSDLCSGLPRDRRLPRTEEMDPSSDLHFDGISIFLAPIWVKLALGL